MSPKKGKKNKIVYFCPCKRKSSISKISSFRWIYNTNHIFSSKNLENRADTKNGRSMTFPVPAMATTRPLGQRVEGRRSLDWALWTKRAVEGAASRRSPKNCDARNDAAAAIAAVYRTLLPSFTYFCDSVSSPLDPIKVPHERCLAEKTKIIGITPQAHYSADTYHPDFVVEESEVR